MLSGLSRNFLNDPDKMPDGAMIPRTENKCQRSEWKNLLREGFTRPGDLLNYLGLHHDKEAGFSSEQLFKLRVPQPFVDKMNPGDWHDPLLLQVLPQASEFAMAPGFGVDPLNERHQLAPESQTLIHQAPGILHKYRSRALVLTTGACAINCRYCFRRHFPYAAHQDRKDFQQVLSYFEQTTSINEAILSGGDPLMLDDDKLSSLITALKNIPHIKRIRIHTRLPVVLPQRIDDALLAWCEPSDEAKIIFVIHCNHPQELGHDTEQALKYLCDAKVTLLNQSVLLKNINDNAQILADLSEKLFAQGVLPYYLHSLDKTQGTQHFDLSNQSIINIYRELMTLLPGFLLPRLVKDSVGASSKTPWKID